MSQQELETFYSQRITEFTEQLRILTSRINIVSYLRIAFALLFILFAYLSLSGDWNWYPAALVIPFFLYLVKKHALLFNEKTHVENIITINTLEKDNIEGNFSANDPGADFIDPAHPYSHDLDIFGAGSLFQYLNRCYTLSGRKKLALHLQSPLDGAITISATQAAIKEIQQRVPFMQDVQASAMEAHEQDSDRSQLLSWLKQPPIIRNKRFTRILLIVLPCITISALVLTFFFPLAKILLFSCIITQWIIAGVMLQKVNVFHDYIGRKKNILEKYSKILAHVEQETFTSDRLVGLSVNAADASKKVKHLANLVSALDARANSIITVFVNSFLLYDLQCVFRLEMWRENNATRLPTWLETIAETEVIVSYGTFAFNHPRFCYALIDNTLKVEGTDLAHPLIPEHERIGNSIAFGPEPSVLIITGANMAGKSTFLRTLGLNLVLALNGLPVCATQFSCAAIKIRSGMRTADSLKDHQSYFYAELNRLKTIMEELRTGQPLMILLDEILKGTNSNDKQAGSIALVRQLLPYPCLTVIATHDLVLGDLEKEFPKQIRNYSFEPNIENDQLTFDYKLKEGIATKMNASFLMRKMGIIPD